MSKKNWKDAFLSTGIPLEYEVMKIFNSKDEIFKLIPEFSYEREHLGEVKEFSIDLLVRQYYSESNDSQPYQVQINYLIECKYRAEEKYWLFIPNLDRFPYEEEIPNSFIYLTCFNNDKEHNTTRISVREFSEALQRGYKGTEFHKYKNEFYEGGILRGAYQLLYAVPNLIAQNLEEFVDSKNESIENGHFHIELICPILVTNCELRILKKELDTSVVSDSKSIEDISDEVDFLTLSINNSNSYIDYSNRIITNELKSLEFKHKEFYDSSDESYFEELNEMYKEIMLFQMFKTNVIVCNVKHLEELIYMIQNTTVGMKVRRNFDKYRFK